MKAKDLLKFALTGLRHRKARTFLTVLGVIIGSICIVLMIAIGLSNYKHFEKNMLSDQSLSEITITNYPGNTVRTVITDSIIQSLSSLPHIKAISPVIDIPVTLIVGDYVAYLQLRGVDLQILDLNYDEGGIFSTSNSIPSIVLGGNTIQNFIDQQNPPKYSDYISMEKYHPDIDLMASEMIMSLGNEHDNTENQALQQYRVTVSGITQKTNSELSYNAYIDIATAKRILLENRELTDQLGLSVNSYNTVKIVVDELEEVENVVKEIKKLGYETYSPTESLMQLQEEQSRQQWQLFAIGFISLFVSAIGIANTMYSNILERKCDIGVMKVLGMQISRIRDLFILESALIGLLGGLIGIATSYVITVFINISTSESHFLGMYFSEGMTISIPLWLATGALLIAVGVGILSGIYPAYKAIKMSSLEAMR